MRSAAIVMLSRAMAARHYDARLPMPDPELAEGSESKSSAQHDIEVIEPALERLPPDQREAITEIIETQLSHSGPLPSPGQLAEYNLVLPGLAERIVRLTEKEQEHRHTVVSTAVRRAARLRERGQVMGMAALLVTLAFCAYLATLGYPTIAGTVAVALVIGVVGIFVTGKVVDSKSQSESSETE